MSNFPDILLRQVVTKSHKNLQETMESIQGDVQILVTQKIFYLHGIGKDFSLETAIKYYAIVTNSST